MQQQLQRIATSLEESRKRVERLARGIPADRFSTRRVPERWSVAECIAHLNMTSRAYIPLLCHAFDDPRVARLKAPQMYRRDAVGWLMSFIVGPMPRIGGRRMGRMKTEPAFVPTGDMDKTRIVAEFEALQDQVVALVREAEGRSLEHMRIISPFRSSVSYNAYSTLVIIARHQVRHLDQAEDVWTS